MAKSRRPPPRGRRVDAKGRSVGGGHHVRLYRWELDSPAYRSLTSPARCLLVELKALYNGGNNSELFLSVRDAAKRLGTGKTLAASCFVALLERGFIQVARQGTFHVKAAARRGDATAWLLTEFPPGDGKGVGTKDFVRWPPTGQGHEPKSIDGPRGRTRCPSTRTPTLENGVWGKLG